MDILSHTVSAWDVRVGYGKPRKTASMDGLILSVISHLGITEKGLTWGRDPSGHNRIQDEGTWLATKVVAMQSVGVRKNSRLKASEAMPLDLLVRHLISMKIVILEDITW